MDAKTIAALHNKIQQARKKYGIENFEELLAKMEEMGDFRQDQTSPLNKKYGDDYTLEELRLMSDQEFEDALEGMTEGEMSEVFYYLSGSSERQKQIEEIQMERTNEKILNFNMPEEPRQEQREQARQEPSPRYNPKQREAVRKMDTLLSGGREDEPSLEFPKSMREGMGEAIWQRGKEKQREQRKNEWMKLRQDFIDKWGRISNENQNEFKQKVGDFETYLVQGGNNDE